MLCKLTGKEGKAVDAHIIPRSFYPTEATKPLMQMQSEVKHYPKRSWTGVYDSGILTEEGERLLSDYDAHASDVFQKLIRNRKPLNTNETTVGFIVEGVDYRLLKLFFISLVWRASVSTHRMFSRVSLGASWEEKAREHILSNDPGSPEDFAVTVAVFDDVIDSGFGILDPVQTRIGSINYYLFYLNNALAYIKVDQRPSEEPWVEGILRPEKPLLLVNRGKFRSSKEYPVMRSIVLKNDEFTPDWWKKKA